MLLTYGDLARYQDDSSVFLMDIDGNQWSATYGDYFMEPDDEPITDCNGDPMMLCRKHTTIEVILGEETR